MGVISTENAEHYTWGNNCDGWHLAKSADLSIIEERVPPGSSEVRHYHERAEQFFYVLSGIATLGIEGEQFEVQANNGLHIPAGKPHQLSNETDEDLKFLVVSTPPSHDDRIKT